LHQYRPHMPQDLVYSKKPTMHRQFEIQMILSEGRDHHERPTGISFDLCPTALAMSAISKVKGSGMSALGRSAPPMSQVFSKSRLFGNTFPGDFSATRNRATNVLIDLCQVGRGNLISNGKLLVDRLKCTTWGGLPVLVLLLFFFSTFAF
jgi:hypothetical protein